MSQNRDAVEASSLECIVGEGDVDDELHDTGELLLGEGIPDLVALDVFLVAVVGFDGNCDFLAVVVDFVLSALLFIVFELVLSVLLIIVVFFSGIFDVIAVFEVADLQDR